MAGCLTAVCAFSLSTTTSFAQDDVGLKAIFRDAVLNEPPWGIRGEDFSGLSESWGEWSDKTQELLEKLYGFEPLTIEQQEQLLAELNEQLDLTYPAFQSEEELANQDLLVDLEGKIARRIAIYEATLELLKKSSDQSKDLQPVLAQLFQSLERYESDDRDVDIKLNDEAPETVPQLISTLEGMSSNSSSLVDKIRINYYNFNVRTFVSEPFADFAFYECRRECGPICDCILGARVTGTQRTKSGVYIDFLPSDDSAKFAIRINGNTRSNTRGVTDQATVLTTGNHYFTGKKELEYDGNVFSYYRASLGVNANNHVRSAYLNRRGLIAKLIGDKIAYEKAVDKMPESERIAAYKLRKRVLPKFNQEIEDSFNDMNKENKKRRKRMAAEGIAPNEVLARTDDDELRTAERLMNEGQLGADRASTAFNSPTGMTLHVHESWVNNALAIDTIDLEPGQALPFPEFSQQLAEKFRRAFDITKEREPAEDSGDDVIIYDVDPLHVQFEGGLIKVILRIGLKSEDRENPIAIRRVEIPIEYVLEEDQIRLQISETRDVYSKPLDTSDPNYRRGEDPVIANKIKERFQERLAEETFDRHILFEADEENGKKVPVTIASLHTVNGWMVVVVEPDERE
ncbi:hypothetical protein Pan54_05950 [Rubinisphaera italica]|uniref:Uncharacterized protein n=1 Tax=Rubinisphaera italica TaxID=2527969 RepID=A0A5C5XAP7_9PLAN|nr:hypothetical protein Pan54_05950 [Rubinisphaera italica]